VESCACTRCRAVWTPGARSTVLYSRHDNRQGRVIECPSRAKKLSPRGTGCRVPGHTDPDPAGQRRGRHGGAVRQRDAGRNRARWVHQHHHRMGTGCNHGLLYRRTHLRRASESGGHPRFCRVSRFRLEKSYALYPGASGRRSMRPIPTWITPLASSPRSRRSRKFPVPACSTRRWVPRSYCSW
jgi:hypothetical protein